VRAKDPEKSLKDVERQLGEVDAILGDLLASARAGLSDLRVEKTRLLPWLRARVTAEATPPVPRDVASDEAEGSSFRSIPPSWRAPSTT